jgi:hypothetical protein
LVITLITGRFLALLLEDWSPTALHLTQYLLTHQALRVACDSATAL